MASITSAGIGSGLDVNSLVSQLVAAERAAPDQRLSTQQTKAQTTISALGTFSSALASLQKSAQALRDGAATRLVASSGNTTLATVTATTSASAGSYSVEVVQLAKANKLASSAYADSTTAVGTGSLSIGVGSKSFNLNIDSSNNTLAGIRDAINSASDNSGVVASLLNTSDGVRLTLTSSSTGSSGAISVSSSGGDGGLAALDYSPSGSQKMVVVDPAQDAKLNIDGFSFSSSSNVFSDAVQGVTFTANQAQAGTTFNVTVGTDTQGAQSAMQSFVTSYNALNATISQMTSYDATSNTAGPLLGDSVVLSLTQQLQSVMTSTLGSNGLQSLSQLGVTGNTDGSYSFSASTFQSVLSASPGAVSQLLGKGGFGDKISNLADGYLSTGSGLIANETDSLQSQLKDIARQQSDLNDYMTQVQARYQAQFSALDTLMSQMKATGDYLTQQLANLPGTTSSASK